MSDNVIDIACKKDDGDGKPPVKEDLAALDEALQEARSVIEVATTALVHDEESAVVATALVAGVEMLRAVEHRLDLLSMRLYHEGCAPEVKQAS